MANMHRTKLMNTRNWLYRRRLLLDGSGGYTEPAWANVAFRATFDGTDEDTSYTTEDANTYAMTFTSSPKLDDTQTKFGTTAAYFDSNGDVLTAGTMSGDLDTMSGSDWAVEGWMYNEVDPASHSDGGHMLMHLGSVAHNQRVFSFYIRTDGELGLMYSTTGTDEVFVTSTGADFTGTGTWNHLAMSFDDTAGTLRMFANGTMVYEDSHPGLRSTSAHFGSDLQIGRVTDFPDARQHYGWIDDVRVVVGEVVYTDDFTVPTEARPTS